MQKDKRRMDEKKKGMGDENEGIEVVVLKKGSRVGGGGRKREFEKGP